MFKGESQFYVEAREWMYTYMRGDAAVLPLRTVAPSWYGKFIEWIKNGHPLKTQQFGYDDDTHSYGEGGREDPCCYGEITRLPSRVVLYLARQLQHGRKGKLQGNIMWQTHCSFKRLHPATVNIAAEM